MTAYSWNVADQNVVGVSASGLLNNFLQLVWGPYRDTDLPFAESPNFPWPSPNYPSLLVLGLGLTFTATAAVAARRPRVTVTYPNSATFDFVAANTLTAGQTRTYEFGVGMALDTSAAGQMFREVLPEGLVLLPGSELGAPHCTMNFSLDNFQTGDSCPGVTITGMLLFGA